jgi:hypothetical protein
VRVILDLDTDGHGRPVGCLQADQEHVTEFGDWLELLRLLEACIDRAKTGAGTRRGRRIERQGDN